MSKKSKIHFLTSYIEYLLDQGIRSEEHYLGDASRFLRYLLASASTEEIRQYIHGAGRYLAYRRRLEKTLHKFFTFAQEQLGIDSHQCFTGKKEPDDHLVP